MSHRDYAAERVVTETRENDRELHELTGELAGACERPERTAEAQ